MNDNMIMINKDDFEQFTFNEVQKMRHILFNICCEDYILMPRTEALREKGKDYIKMPLNDWKTYIDDVSIALGDLMTARDIIKVMKPIFDEYREEYEKAHDFTFDDYIKMCTVSYDSDEFERVRERFEEEYFKDISEDDEAR